MMLSIYSMHLYVQGHGYNLYINCFFPLENKVVSQDGIKEKADKSS